MHNCLVCGLHFDTALELTNHTKREHNLNRRAYYDIYLKRPDEGTCHYEGCTNSTKFSRGHYLQFCSQEHARKSKQTHNKINATCIAKYGGVGLQSETIKKKVKNACKDKYGVENAYQIDKVKKNSHSKEARSKATATIKKKYIDSSGKNSIVEKGQLTKKNRIQKFCEDNECIPANKLIAEYGVGWYKSGKFTNSLLRYYGQVFVKTTIIDKIAKYVPDRLSASKFEKDIREYVESICDDVEHNVRNVISPYELDIYIPSKRVAIECNGVYWHSTACKPKDYHLNKTELCEDIGVYLIHIFDYEWYDKPEVCKSIISSALNEYRQEINADDCEIRKLTSKEAKEFFSVNSLDTLSKSSYRLGLYYEDRLVQVIAINRYRNTHTAKICTKLYTRSKWSF